MFRGAGHIAIVALHILPFTSHVYALELNVDSQGKDLDIHNSYLIVEATESLTTCVSFVRRVDQKCREHRRLQHDEMVQGIFYRQPGVPLEILVGRRCFVSGMSQLLACY